MTDVSIISYEPRFQPAFKQLNLEWISHHFAVEPHDLEQLDNPELYVLPNQGQIFFALVADQVMGCVAMINTSTPGRHETSFELAKMAVAPTARGGGIGRKLCETALAYARQVGAETVWLESNRRLTPALSMYQAVGFQEVPSLPTPYSRADISMEIRL